jgi:hypothetical protein
MEGGREPENPRTGGMCIGIGKPKNRRRGGEFYVNGNGCNGVYVYFSLNVCDGNVCHMVDMHGMV